MKEIKGVFPIIPTTYTENGELDLDSLRNVIKTRAEAGVNGLTLFGIAGEYYKQSDEEGRRQAKVVADECRKSGIPSVMSVTQHSTKLACEQAKFLEDIGADCLMTLPPFFLKPSGEEIYKHTKAILNAVNIPVVIQYAPNETGVSITPDTWIRLSKECENAEYFKIECKPSGGYISKMIRMMETTPRIFIGNCGFQMIEAFDRGSIGVMPSCAIAEVYIKVYREYQKGNKEEAIKIHNAFLPLYNHTRQNVEMSIYYEKKIMKLRGVIESDYCRAPGFTPDKYFDDLFFYHYEQLKPYLD